MENQDEFTWESLGGPGNAVTWWYASSRVLQLKSKAPTLSTSSSLPNVFFCRVGMLLLYCTLLNKLLSVSSIMFGGILDC
jgi:hypothetical protein